MGCIRLENIFFNPLEVVPPQKRVPEKKKCCSAYRYVFQFKDHLSNVRLSYSDSDLNGSIDPQTEIIEENNYYPFGMLQTGYNRNVNGGNDLAQKYKFGGKEYQEEFSINWYDVTARNYDPALGRWMNIDPLAENGRRFSPYNYSFNNPVYFMDYDGMWPTPPWLKKYATSAWKATGNLIEGAITSTYSGARNAINETKKVYNAYKKDGASGAAKQYVNSVYETSGAKNAIETTKKAATGDPEALAATVVNTVALVITHKASKSSTTKSTPTSKTTANKATPSIDLQAQVNAAAAEIKASGQAPGAVVGAELEGSTSIAASGTPPSTVAPALEAAANKIGGVGTRTPSGNVVGCCGEFRAANNLLLENPSATPNQVIFTDAIRPRNGQVIPPCDNCQAIFPQLQQQ